MFHNRVAIATMIALLGQFSGAYGQEATFSLELSKIEEQTKGCLAIFRATNRLGVKLTETILQIYVLDKEDLPLSDLALNFKDFRPAQTKFLKFPLPHPCASISNLHPNEFKCTGDKDLTQACSEGLRTSSRTTIKFDTNE